MGSDFLERETSLAAELCVREIRKYKVTMFDSRFVKSIEDYKSFYKYVKMYKDMF